MYIARLLGLTLLVLSACVRPPATSPRPEVGKPAVLESVGTESVAVDEPSDSHGQAPDALDRGTATDMRARNLAKLDAAGFHPSKWLPTSDRRYDEPARLRPLKEIAGRAMALQAVFFWCAAPEDVVPSQAVRDYIARSNLETYMTDDERSIMAMERTAAVAAHKDNIGWRLENLWALAWVLGYDQEPPVGGSMITDGVIRAVLLSFLPGMSDTLAVFEQRLEPRSEAEVLAVEDLFYCAHNAARSAQLGTKGTVPDGFHPIIGTGVIHERRHALTWVLSPGTSWDDTDLST